MDHFEYTEMRKGIHGLQSGIVMQLADPENEFSALVILVLGNKNIWAKLVNSFSYAHAEIIVIGCPSVFNWRK